MNKIDQITYLLQQGLSYAECARRLGVSRQRIHQLAQKNGLTKTPTIKPQSNLSQRRQNFSLGPTMYANCSAKYHRKKQNCKRNNIPFEVSFEELEWPKTCPILGITLIYENIEDWRVEGSPSFDKINPALGYVSGNVRIISWRANRIKNDGTAEEHRKIADYIDKSVQ